MNAEELTLRHGFSGRSDEERYLAALNTCFGGWGDRRRFDWCFTRDGARRRPDILQLESPRGPIAGSAVTYRTVRVECGVEVVAGIMTGSWTLPDARGAGAFTRLIAASREAVAAAGGTLLLAFVTAANPSRRRLDAAGAGMVPTWYCRSAGTAGQRDDGLRAVAAAGIAQRPIAPTAVGACFCYTGDDWQGQFVGRPDDVRLVQRPGRWTALVELAPGFARLLTLDAAPGDRPAAIDALTAHARHEGRELFAFTMHADECALLRERGFVVGDGFLAVDVIGQAVGVPRHWHVEHGDRM